MEKENVKNQIVLNNVYEVVTKQVKPYGAGGAHVTLPKEWLDCEVQVILLKD